MRTRRYSLWIASLVLLSASAAQAQDSADAALTRAELTRNLNEHVNVLARNPHDFRALFGAANTALAMGDISAAEGFFRRAEARAPGDYRIKQGLAAVALRRGQPRIAMTLFEEARELGAPEDSAATERGLAFDLLGDQRGAQTLYRTAIENDEGDEAVRRLALSLAISGDARESERTLRPLMSRQDRAAYRVRAFALAAMGRTDDAVTVAAAMLPATQASRMEPYLRYLPRLSAAQKAAAGNLGLFPRVADLDAVAGTAPRAAVAASDRSEGNRLVPAGEPLGNRPSAPASPAASADADVAAAQVPAQAAAPREEAPNGAAPRPGFDLAAVSQPEPAAPERASGPEPVELEDAFADFSLPVPDASQSEAQGAVDLTSFEPRREKPEPKPEPSAEEKAKADHPRRHWVQVATGRDRDALAFDWRRIHRGGGDALGEGKGHIAGWNATNRLLAGPYRSAQAAQAVVTELKAKGIDSFTFTSAAGEEVLPIAGR